MTSSDALREALLELCWSQWASLGVSAAPAAGTLQAIDLEALLLLTFEIGRDDPRLFDEALGWLHDNASRLNTNRLRTLASDELDRRLTDATLHWLAAQGRGARRARLDRAVPSAANADDVELFPGDRPERGQRDPSFAAHGIVRRTARPSGKSTTPDLLAPACFALRLRAMFGLGVKAELVRALLTIDAPWVDLGVLEASAAYTGRSTRDGLADLVGAGVVTETRVSGRGRYAMPREPWLAALSVEPSARPQNGDWPQLFSACRRLVRSAGAAPDASASAYLRASAARELWSAVEPDLRYAGVYLPRLPFSPGEAFLDEFDDALGAVTTHIRTLIPG